MALESWFVMVCTSCAMPMKARAVEDGEEELKGCDELTTGRGKARNDMHIPQNFPSILKVERWSLQSLGQLV
jgi:hypothetical protein